MNQLSLLRWVFLAACVGCVAVVARNERWEARLRQGATTWFMDLGRYPVWAPPELPDYASFQELFPDLRIDREARPRIVRVLKTDWMLVDLFLWLWPVTLIHGILYMISRGTHRDPILHGGWSAGVGLTLAAVVCIGIWMVVGGWGPPAPALFGVVGLIGGVVGGVAYFRARSSPRRGGGSIARGASPWNPTGNQ